jgi:hypothetical protein
MLKIVARVEVPVKSGAIQFCDDCPGLFLRGGECIGLSTAIQRLLETIGSDTTQRNPTLLESLLILSELRELIERDSLVEEIIRHATKRGASGSLPLGPGF